MSLTRRDMIRLALSTAGLSVADSRSARADAAPRRYPPPHRSTCRAGVDSTCSTSSWSTSRSPSRSATSPTSPSLALTSSGCRWITGAGLTVRPRRSSRSRSSRRSTRRSSSDASMVFTFRSTFTGLRGSPLPVRRSRSRSGPTPRSRASAPPLGEFRGALSGRAQQSGQLQPAQ